MAKQANVDIDYEHLDDLPLSKHFEWHFFQVENNDIFTKKSNRTQVEKKIDLTTLH